jgi:hypothetical protein
MRRWRARRALRRGDSSGKAADKAADCRGTGQNKKKVVFTLQEICSKDMLQGTAGGSEAATPRVSKNFATIAVKKSSFSTLPDSRGRGLISFLHVEVLQNTSRKCAIPD